MVWFCSTEALEQVLIWIHLMFFIIIISYFSISCDGAGKTPRGILQVISDLIKAHVQK